MSNFDMTQDAILLHSFFNYDVKLFYYRRGWDYPSTCPLVIDFVTLFFELKKLHPEKEATLELETRLGTHEFLIDKGQTVSPEHYARLAIHKQSYTIPEVINARLDTAAFDKLPKETSGKVRAQLDKMRALKKIADSPNYAPNLSLRFDPTVPPSFFFSRLRLFKDNTRFPERAVVELDPEFTIDIKTRGSFTNGRLTLNLSNGKFTTTEKRYKSNIDITSNGVEYRLSGAIEMNKDVSAGDVLNHLSTNDGVITQIRVKLRSKFLLVDSLEASFTRVFELRLSNPNTTDGNIYHNATLGMIRTQIIDSIVEGKISNEATITLKAWVLSRMESYHIPKHEMEIEYYTGGGEHAPINRLQNIYEQIFINQPGQNSMLEKKLYFDTKINTFLMNSEMLFSYAYRHPIEDEINQAEYKSFMSKKNVQSFPLPEIGGEYLNSVLVAEKQQVLPQHQRRSKNNPIPSNGQDHKPDPRNGAH